MGNDSEIEVCADYVTLGVEKVNWNLLRESKKHYDKDICSVSNNSLKYWLLMIGQLLGSSLVVHLFCVIL